jgi:hypothetical protein
MCLLGNVTVIRGIPDLVTRFIGLYQL